MICTNTTDHIGAAWKLIITNIWITAQIDCQSFDALNHDNSMMLRLILALTHPEPSVHALLSR